jgi:hypothetical protein
MSQEHPAPLPAALPDAQIDALAAHPHWEALGSDLDVLALQVPPTSERAERTTLLTWIHAQQGVATFDELSQKLTGLASLPKRKKHLRQALRAMERMLLVHIVNFPGGGADAPEPDEDVVGRNSMVSLTWTGMLWLRRAWSARERLARHRDIALVHKELVEEEEEAGWTDPYWVENVCSLDADDSQRPASRARNAQPPITSIFDLANPRG